MLGEYLREGAVLVVIFVPLDLWKHSEINLQRIAILLLSSIGVLASGMVMHWISLFFEALRKFEERNEEPPQ